MVSLWGCRDHPTVVHCSRGSSPFAPLDPSTHTLHIYCIITDIIDIHLLQYIPQCYRLLNHAQKVCIYPPYGQFTSHFFLRDDDIYELPMVMPDLVCPSS